MRWHLRNTGGGIPLYSVTLYHPPSLPSFRRLTVETTDRNPTSSVSDVGLSPLYRVDQVKFSFSSRVGSILHLYPSPSSWNEIFISYLLGVELELGVAYNPCVNSTPFFTPMVRVWDPILWPSSSVLRPGSVESPNKYFLSVRYLWSRGLHVFLRSKHFCDSFLPLQKNTLYLTSTARPSPVPSRTVSVTVLISSSF